VSDTKPKSEQEHDIPQWLIDASEGFKPMTQEELFSALEEAFSADTGIMSIPTQLSHFIDLYSEDEFEHDDFIKFFEWVLDLHNRISQE
jgi:hypothetical protein